MEGFDRVAAGGGPEIAVLLGESGLGKTRLVQEFFSRLSRAVDSAGDGGYWPDRLVRDTNNLKINPDPADCNPSRVADMRFLWWGIRMLDRSGHNAGMGGVSETVSLLRAHLEPFARARLTTTRIKQAAKSAAFDVAIEIGNLFTFGLLGLGKLGLDHASEWRSIHEDHRSLDGFAPGSETERQRDSLVDIVLADLGALFDAGENKGERLPAVVLLDDAQWLSGDETTQILVARLLHRAQAQRWPLLIVATHWEKEWYEHEAADDGVTFASLAAGFAHEGWKPLKLGKEPDLAGMIRSGYPGLSAPQLQLVLDKADGNPRLLDEILRFLRRKRSYFEDRDTDRALSPRGESELRRTTFGLHELVAERFACAPEDVRIAIGIAGLQGLRFLEHLTFAVGEEVGAPNVQAGLRLAEKPHSAVARVGASLSEFTQGVFRDVALDQLPDLIDEGLVRERMVARIVALAGEDGEFAELDPEERDAAYLIVPELLTSDRDPSDAECALVWRCLRKAAEASVERHTDPQTVSILRQSTDMLDRGLSCSPEESADDLLKLLTIAGRMHLAKLARKLAAALEAMLGEIEETQATQDLRADLFSALSWSAKLYGDLQRAGQLQSAEVDVLVEIADRSGTREDRLRVLVARVRLAWMRARARESEAARATVDEVVEAVDRIERHDGDAKARHHIFWCAGITYAQLSEPRAAIACCDRAAAVLEGLNDTTPTVVRHEMQASVASLRGSLLNATGNSVEATKASEEALTLRRQIFEEDPSQRTRGNVLSIAARLGRYYRTAKDYDRSMELTQECLRLAHDMVYAIPSRHNRIELVEILRDAGDHLAARKSLRNAERYYREALDAARALHREDPAPDSVSILIGSLNRVALGLMREGNLELALAHREEALALLVAGKGNRYAVDTASELIEAQERDIAELRAKIEGNEN
jgi:tetratricopeptide (TPR) repeat protein